MSNRQVSEGKTFPHKVFLQTVVFALNSPAVMIGVTKLFLLAFAVQSFIAGASESTIETLNSLNTPDSNAEPMSTDSSAGMSTSGTLEEYIPENNITSDNDGEPDNVYVAQPYVIDEDMSDNGTFVPHYRKNITIHREKGLRVYDDDEETIGDSNNEGYDYYGVYHDEEDMSIHYDKNDDMDNDYDDYDFEDYYYDVD